MPLAARQVNPHTRRPTTTTRRPVGARARLRLLHPVSVAGETHEALTMRRPKVRDVKSAERSGGGSNAETEIRLFANLCEVAPAVIEELDLADYERLQAEFGAMVPKADSPRPPT